jgi:hypothetical protein
MELGQTLPASSEWIRVTAEYSNAVLVAVMPYVSNVAQKLDLPVSSWRRATSSHDVLWRLKSDYTEPMATGTSPSTTVT